MKIVSSLFPKDNGVKKSGDKKLDNDKKIQDAVDTLLSVKNNL